MQPWLWILLGCFIWMVIGLFAMGEASKKYPFGHLWPPPEMGIPIIDAFFLPLWLMLWPLNLARAPSIHRYYLSLEPKPRPIRIDPLKLSPGTLGKTVTPLQPGGKIDVGGVRYGARSQHGHIDSGVPIVVVGNWMRQPIVKPTQAPQQPE